MIQPLDHRILVKRFKFERKASPIFLTDAEESRLAIVLAAGPGKRLKNGGRRPMGVRVGDIVLLPGVASIEPDWIDADHLLVTEDDVGLIVHDEVNVRSGTPHAY